VKELVAERRERVTVREAAARLGITESAVRKRVRKGDLRSEKVMEGNKERLYVFLDRDKEPFLEPFQEKYVRSLENRVKTLEDEVYRQQAIILNMTEAMKVLSPPAQTSPERPLQGPETAGEPRSSTGSPDHAEKPFTDEDDAEPQGTPRSKVPWWRRIFGR
jgi:excisionase family DNA binding protein